MKKYLVALDPESRFSRPAVEKFEFMPAFKRLVWRKEATACPHRLSELFNEALDCAERMNHADLRLRVISQEVPDETPAVANTAPPAPPAPTEAAPKPPPQATQRISLPDLPAGASPGARRRRRRLLTQTH
jgi:hypothetical protein